MDIPAAERERNGTAVMNGLLEVIWYCVRFHVAYAISQFSEMTSTIEEL